MVRFETSLLKKKPKCFSQNGLDHTNPNLSVLRAMFIFKRMEVIIWTTGTNTLFRKYCLLFYFQQDIFSI